MSKKIQKENLQSELNKLVLVGNGFDLAHGLKTTYKNFLGWYICQSFLQFCRTRSYSDELIEIHNKYTGMITAFTQTPKSIEEVQNLISINENQYINYKSRFLKRLIEYCSVNNWVEIEQAYFNLLKSYFSNPNISDKEALVRKLNQEFDFLISRLCDYITIVNSDIGNVHKLTINSSKNNLKAIFATPGNSSIKFINFNYTDTLLIKQYAKETDVIHIHGSISDLDRNPIIFGYGDESDPSYQKIEDSGINAYLEHIKSFAYFRTNNYQQLLSFIDSSPYTTIILGQSCGLSDRILLSEIFEHKNCKNIEIFYHRRPDGSDNFKEITQQISRHFKAPNKNIMRRRIIEKNFKNFIPQNS